MSDKLSSNNEQVKVNAYRYLPMSSFFFYLILFGEMNQSIYTGYMFNGVFENNNNKYKTLKKISIFISLLHGKQTSSSDNNTAR